MRGVVNVCSEFCNVLLSRQASWQSCHFEFALEMVDGSALLLLTRYLSLSRLTWSCPPANIIAARACTLGDGCVASAAAWHERV